MTQRNLIPATRGLSDAEHLDADIIAMVGARPSTVRAWASSLGVACWCEATGWLDEHVWLRSGGASPLPLIAGSGGFPGWQFRIGAALALHTAERLDYPVAFWDDAAAVVAELLTAWGVEPFPISVSREVHADETVVLVMAGEPVEHDRALSPRIPPFLVPSAPEAPSGHPAIDYFAMRGVACLGVFDSIDDARTLGDYVEVRLYSRSAALLYGGAHLADQWAAPSLVIVEHARQGMTKRRV